MSKHLNRLLAMLLAMILVLSLFPVALAAEPVAKEEPVEENALAFGTGLLPAIPHGSARPSGTDASTQGNSSHLTEDLPASYDSRDYGYITPVRNQGDYNTCWAFGTAASCEAYMIKHGVLVGESGQPADTSLNLSEYHLAYYTYTDAYDAEGMLTGDKTYFLSTHSNGNFLEAGGTGELVSYPLMRWTGLADESDPALVYGAASTAGLGSEHAYQNNVAHVQSVKHFFGSNVEEVKRHIMEYGAGSMGVRVSNTSGTAYHGGVNTSNGTICWIQSAVAYQDTGFYYADHDVTVVGWDDNYSKENFNQGYRPTNNGAWIVKNSWGTDIGNDGYFYVSYEDSATRASYISFFTVENVDNFDHNYQYDGSGNYYNSEEMVNGDSVAQVFTANGNETLEAIALALYGDNTDYTIKIYTGCSTDDPTTGTLAATKTGNFDYWGYQTIYLDNPVTLAPGQRFAVVISFSGDDINVAYDTTIQEDTYYHMGLIHMTHPNTSYFKGVNDSTWTNKSGDGNYRIKAYTKDIPEDPVPMTLSYVALGSVYDTVSGTAGDKIRLSETAPAADGWTFQGWVTAPVAETAEKPTFYKPGATFKLTTSIQTLYALYMRAEAINAPVTYELITAAPDTWIGKYVLVAIPTTGSTEYALTGVSAGTDGTNIENTSNGASTLFTSTGITRNGTTLSNVSEQYVFEAAATNYGLSLQSVSEGSYLGSKNTGSGTAAYTFFAFPAFQEANTTWTFEIDDDEMYLKNNSAGQIPYLAVSGSFGFSLTRFGSEFKFYKQNPTENYYYSTEIGGGEHDHVLSYVAATAPTCTEEGNIAYYRCSICGVCFSDAQGQNQISSASVVIAATGHTPGAAQRVNETAPTCGAAGGYDDVVSCTVCGQELSRTHTTLPATGEHTYGDWSSNNDSTHSRTCSVCGSVETVGCTLTDTVVAPTETTQGYTEHTCSVCGYSYRDAYVPALGSEFTVHFSVPAGVTAPADMVSNTNTGITLPTAEAPEGYTFLGWVTEDYDNVETRPATILTGNYIAPQEITLKALYTYTEGNSGSETVYELVSTAPSDIAGDYVITFGTSETSNEQGFFLMKGVEAATSNYGIESPANRVAFADTGATLDGTTLKNVANDYVFNVAFLGTYYTIQSKSTGIYLGMNNSSYFSAYDTYNSTYCRWTIPAVADNFCSAKNARSGASYPYISFGYESSQYSEPYFWAGSSSSIGATGLALSVRWWKATEIEAGTAYYTTIIGEEHVHTPAAPVKENEVPATCTEAGSYDAVVYCSECGEEISRETIAIPALGHNYESVVTAPTCTEQGFTTHTCSRCGDSYVDNYTDALGHDFGEWIVTTEPTCTALGTETRTCSRCNATETRDAAALGHDYQAVVTAPTCTEAGYTTYTCSRCGDSYTADEVAALGHLAGEAVEENRVEPTTTTEGGYDTVVYCQRCGAELSREHTVLPMITVEYFVNNSISLAGDIGVNFYVNLNEVSKDNAKVVFTWGSDKYAKTKEATFSGLTANKDGNYKLSVQVYAKQMTEVIHAELYDGTEKIAEKDYSVADYCRTVLNMPIKELADAYYDGNEAKAEKLVNLCKAMLIYGGMAQKQFKYRTDDRADKDLEYTLEDVGALGTTTFPEGFAEACGIEFKMSSLMLESETSYRMYFSVKDQTKLDNLTVKLGDETLTYTKNGSYIYYSISNIPAKMILSDYTLTFGDQTVTANAGEYIAKALDKGNDDLKETAKALYWYSTAAIEYFAS